MEVEVCKRSVTAVRGSGQRMARKRPTSNQQKLETALKVLIIVPLPLHFRPSAETAPEW